MTNLDWAKGLCAGQGKTVADQHDPAASKKAHMEARARCYTPCPIARACYEMAELHDLEGLYSGLIFQGKGRPPVTVDTWHSSGQGGRAYHESVKRGRTERAERMLASLQNNSCEYRGCGQRFIPTTGAIHQRFCSEQCRNNERDARRRDRRKTA